MMKRIVHIDLDAFFASCEELLHPHLVGTPVIVGGSDRGVVSSCNYIAREYGIHSAMPVTQAKKLCPKGNFVSGSFAQYRSFSQKFFEIIGRYTPLVEVVSIDEAYIDLTGCSVLFGKTYNALLEEIKEVIYRETGLIATCGMGTTKVAARLASKCAKPNGIKILLPQEEKMFIQGLPIGALPGVGPKIKERMSFYNVRTIGDLATMSPAMVEQMIGRIGEHLQELAQNNDERKVIPLSREQVSISKEETFAVDTTSFITAMNHAKYLSARLLYRLRAMDKLAGSVHVKIKTTNHCVRQKSQHLTLPTNDDVCAQRIIHGLLTELMAENGSIRQVGVRFGDFKDARLQDTCIGEFEKDTRVSETMDAIRTRFGFQSIGKGLVGALGRHAQTLSPFFRLSI